MYSGLTTAINKPEIYLNRYLTESETRQFEETVWLKVTAEIESCL